MHDDVPDKPVKEAPKGQHIFNNAELTKIAIQWKELIAQNKREEAMPLLEALIIGCQEMLPRLAQYEGFHRTVDVETLCASASAKIERWLLLWDPNYKSSNGLFSWLSTCAKNAFRSELAKVNQYRRHIHSTGENLEKFFGEEDFNRHKDEAKQEVKSHLKDIAVRWGDLQELGCVRFILDCLVEEKQHSPDEPEESATTQRERIVRSVTYAWCVSPELAKFFYSWAVYSLRDAMYKKIYIPFTEEDVLRHAESYTHLPDLMEIVGWDRFKKVIATLGGNRIKLPTLQQMGRLHENYLMTKEITEEGDDPETVAKIGKKRGKNAKTAQEVFTDMSEMLDHKRCGEHLVYGGDEEN